MYNRAKKRLALWLWRFLVITPLLVVFLLLALILPLTFLSFFGHEWLERNPLNSWVLGALIYATTCYILSTSPGIIRIGEWLVAVDRGLRQDLNGHTATKL